MASSANRISCASLLSRGFTHFLEPSVEYVVQVDVGKEWTNRLSLPCPCFAHEKLAFVDDANLNPFPYQAKHASIPDSLSDHFHELLSHDRVKVSSDV